MHCCSEALLNSACGPLLLFRSALACLIQRDRVLARRLAQQAQVLREERPALHQWARVLVTLLDLCLEQTCQGVGLGVTPALRLLPLPPRLHSLGLCHDHREHFLH